MTLTGARARKYQLRHDVATRRLRVGGRFVTRDEQERMLRERAAQEGEGSSDGDGEQEEGGDGEETRNEDIIDDLDSSDGRSLSYLAAVAMSDGVASASSWVTQKLPSPLPPPRPPPQEQQQAPALPTPLAISAALERMGTYAPREKGSSAVSSPSASVLVAATSGVLIKPEVVETCGPSLHWALLAAADASGGGGGGGSGRGGSSNSSSSLDSGSLTTVDWMRKGGQACERLG